MNGNVVFSNDAPPPSLAKATSSTATRPSIFDAGGNTRGVRNANRGNVTDGDDGMAPKTSRVSPPRLRRAGDGPPPTPNATSWPTTESHQRPHPVQQTDS